MPEADPGQWFSEEALGADASTAGRIAAGGRDVAGEAPSARSRLRLTVRIAVAVIVVVLLALVLLLSGPGFPDLRFCRGGGGCL